MKDVVVDRKRENTESVGGDRVDELRRTFLGTRIAEIEDRHRELIAQRAREIELVELTTRDEAFAEPSRRVHLGRVLDDVARNRAGLDEKIAYAMTRLDARRIGNEHRDRKSFFSNAPSLHARH